MRRLGAVEMFVTSDGGNDLVKSKQIAPENGKLHCILRIVIPIVWGINNQDRIFS